MRLFPIIISLIAINSRAQYRVRINHLSRNDSMECISKQAYHDAQDKLLTIISLDTKCDNLLAKAFEKVATKPDNLRIRVVNNPEDFEHILREVRNRCIVTIIQESIKGIWFFFDCTRNPEINKKSNGVMWVVIIALTSTVTAICAAIGICAFLTFRKNRSVQKQKSDNSVKEQISNRNFNKLSGESSGMKSSFTSSRGTVPEASPTSSRKTNGSTSFSHKRIKKANEANV
ncbi:hypothetical protein ACH3XW_35650 [Acanthocheilonema viteae]